MIPTRPFTLVLVLMLLAVPGATASSDGGGPPSALADLPETLGEDTDAALAAAEAARLFGAFTRDGDAVEGAFTSLRADVAGGAVTDVRVRGVTLLARVDAGIGNATLTVDGPVAVLANETAALTVHNNRYAWTTFRGSADAVHVRPGNGTEVTVDAPGVARVTWWDTTLLAFAEAPTRFSVENGTLRASSPDGYVAFTFTTTPGVFGTPVAPGAWLLAARANGTTVVDALRVLGPAYGVGAADADRLDVNLVGTLGPEADATLLRLEAAGMLAPAAPGKFLVHRGDRYHHAATAEDVVDPADPRASFNATARGDEVRALVRIPPGESGVLTWRRDVTPPRVLEARTENLTDTWAPSERAPLLVTRTDEPATGRLVIPLPDGGVYEKPTVTPAYAHRYRLVGLAPGTTYAYTVTLTDLAGNVATATGNLTTPPVPGDAPVRVEVLTPLDAPVAPGEVTVRFRVTAEDGGTVTATRVNAFLDKRPVTDAVREVAPGVYEITVDAVAGRAQELTLEAAGADGERVTSRLVVQAEAATPFPALAALAGLTLVALARRRP